MAETPRQPSLFEAGTDPLVSLRAPEATVPLALGAYERYLIGARKAPQTVTAFCSDLRQLATFYPHLRLTDLSVAHLRAFLGHLQADRQLADKTITRKTTALKSFGSFLVAAQILGDDPAATLIYPALHPPLPEILSDREVARLLEVVHDKPLWHALIAVLRYTGAKREEVLALRVEDISFDQPMPAVALRKRRPSRYGRDRVVPLNEPLRQILRDYLATLEGPYLFPLHVRSVRWGLGHYAERAGISRPVSAETLRDTFAVGWLRGQLAGEQDLVAPGLDEAREALRQKHDHELLQLVGLAEGTRHAEQALRAYRTLAEATQVAKA